MRHYKLYYMHLCTVFLYLFNGYSYCYYQILDTSSYILCIKYYHFIQIIL